MPTKLYYSLFAVGVLIAFALMTFGFFTARDNHKKQQQSFSLDQISIEESKPLVANFVEINKSQVFSFSFDVTNTSEYDYDIAVSGQVLENGAKLDGTKTFNVKSSKTRTAVLDLPLSFPEDGGVTEEQAIEFTLRLELTTEIAKGSLLGSLAKDLQKDFQVQLKLASDKELASVDIEPSQNNLEYSPNTPFTMRYKTNFINHVNKKHDFGIYEIFLLDSSKKVVQPLSAKDISLQPAQNKDVSESYIFKIPPANQLQPGEQDYYLQIIYSGRIGSRNFKIKNVSEKTIHIKVL